ncbi:3-methyl-2-oxobutanoate hydroxymethyltransferase [Stappia sp. WLB 29]|uniref:3-methyl-2-oxobutanoate hydroxymethyltransferase n=1 Tax=Stappia sp. WLB 29 TaxID=2925220 RepID=UPI0020C076D0|nr:3-methyl-2-oxobutanoate hydroxymethyltransferase [Stappia sp. WLB 29]
MAQITLNTLDARKADGRRFAMVTAYDAGFALAAAGAGIETLLVGDSLGMVVQGRGSTVPVTMDDMAYHTACVRRGVEAGELRPLILADMPFGAANTPGQAAANAARLMQAGANAVKIEGGAWVAETVRHLTERGMPVCAHLGLTPQTADMLGGFRLQGRDEAAAARIREEARVLEEAGARLLLLECVPDALGRAVSEAAKAPVVGIGAGPSTDAQVLVLHDMLGLGEGRKARFVKDYLAGRGSITEALRAFGEEVRSGAYPAPEHCYG